MGKGAWIQPRELAMCWKPQEKLGMGILGPRRRESKGQREFHGFLWDWEEPRDGFSPCTIVAPAAIPALGSTGNLLDPLRSGLQELRNPSQYRFSWNATLWVGRDLGSQHIPWAGTTPTIPGCSKLNPRPLPGIQGQPRLLWNSSPSQAGIFPYFPSSQSCMENTPKPERPKADFRELCHLQLLGKLSGKLGF